MFLLPLSLLVWGCTSDGQPPTPRRHAYPRVRLYDTVYMQADSFSPHFEVNSALQVGRPAPGHMDIVYPAYGAVVYVSSRQLTPGQLEGELDNRRERIALNLNGIPADTEHFSSIDGRYECVMVTTRDVSATPVQFVATDGNSTLVSGAAYFAGVNPASSSDSLAPLVAAVSRDIRHALQNLTDL